MKIKNSCSDFLGKKINPIFYSWTISLLGNKVQNKLLNSYLPYQSGLSEITEIKKKCFEFYGGALYLFPRGTKAACPAVRKQLCNLL